MRENESNSSLLIEEWTNYLIKECNWKLEEKKTKILYKMKKVREKE